MLKLIFKNITLTIFLAVSLIMVSHILGYNTVRHDIGEILRNGIIFILWSGIFATIVQSRLIQPNEHSFVRGFSTGAAFSACFSIIFSIAMAAYQTMINPTFFSTYRAHKLAQLERAGIKDQALLIQMRKFDLLFNGEILSYILLFLLMMMGAFLISAIAAFLYRNPLPNDRK